MTSQPDIVDLTSEEPAAKKPKTKDPTVLLQEIRDLCHTRYTERESRIQEVHALHDQLLEQATAEIEASRVAALCELRDSNEEIDERWKLIGESAAYFRCQQCDVPVAVEGGDSELQLCGDCEPLDGCATCEEQGHANIRASFECGQCKEPTCLVHEARGGCAVCDRSFCIVCSGDFQDAEGEKLCEECFDEADIIY